MPGLRLEILLVMFCMLGDRGRDHHLDPFRKRVQHFGSNLQIVPSRTRRHVKRMIRVLKQFEYGTRSEPLHERLQELQIREFITSPLQEQHRDSHVEEVLSPLV